MISPSDLANLIVWLRADSGCYQDAGLTTPCTNGTTCHTWVNQAGVFNFTQAVAGNQPTWYNTGGQANRPFLTFSSDWLGATMGPYAQPVTMFFGVKYTNIIGPVGIWTASDAAGGLQLSCNYANPYIWAGLNVNTSSLSMDTGSMVQITTLHNRASSFLRQNRVYGYNGAADVGTNSLVNMHLMSDAGGTYRMGGNIYEVIAYNRALTTTEINQVEDYFGGTYALWPNSTTATYSENPSVAARAGVLAQMKVEGVPYTLGASRSDTEGNPSPPCLSLYYPGTSHRFRWGVTAGSRSLTVDAKQVSNVTGKRPRVIVRANPSIGVNSDVIADAGSGTSWVTIGPLSVTPSSSGVLWVELWNMDTATFNSPAFFDHIVTS